MTTTPRMPLIHRPVVRLLTIAVLGIAANLAAVPATPAATFETLHSFCERPHCGDGGSPVGALLTGPKGVLYGATAATDRSHGTVFSLTPRGAGWLFRQLYRFCPRKSGCPDGSSPNGGLIIDVSRNLYGLTMAGGAGNGGVFFELTPPQDRKKPFAEKVLYEFGSYADVEGRLVYAGQAAGIPYDGVSPLYGISQLGGPQQFGELFSLSLSGGTWSKQTLHDFCSEQFCTDGYWPIGDLLADASGKIYGSTTAGGGSSGGGTLFAMAGSHFHTLYDFCSRTSCADGDGVFGGLIQDAAGSLYGTTIFGGTNCPTVGCGVVFRLATDGKQRVLYNFCSQPQCTDGDGSEATLLMDSTGNLYGTTTGGGANDKGTVFKLTGASESVLHDFCSEDGCADGATPKAGLVMDATGNLYGTTSAGGAFGKGTIFRLSP